ncbi:MAG: mono/diheme cytochrome c family protein/rhodanese-related sulfurtransferase [Polaribacter sp.]|jgi:mono/diheme cytochrome c family protein/rhodanese-related sulfurtransferase
MKIKISKQKTPVSQLTCISIISLLFLLVLTTSCSDDDSKYTSVSKKLMGDGLGIGKTLFLVNDLTKTRNYFADTLGFDIPNAERFRKSMYEGVMSTSIRMPDMTSIEFLSIEDSIATNNTPSFISNYLKKHEGIEKYTISSSSIDSTYSSLKKREFKMDTIQSYRTSTTEAKGWSGDDGGSQESSLKFSNSNSTYFPNFIQQSNSDYKQISRMWKSYYSFNRSFSKHPNGVIGLSSIQLAVDTLKVASENFRKMGFLELENSTNKNTASFNVKRNQTIQLNAPSSKNDDVSKFLKERGTGVYAIRFEVKNLDSTYNYLKERLPSNALKLDKINNKITVFRNFAHGVQLEFEKEPESQALMASQLNMGEKLDSATAKNAERMYQKYCALCHAENREGYAADNAPSLRSHSLLASSKSNNFMRYTIQFGRANTAMGGYLDTQGGPLEYIDVEILLQWLYEESGVEEGVEISREPVKGDVEVGAKIYKNNCAVCHGEKGEGISAPALGNPMLLATATDGFLKYAISEGRDSTPMIAYKNILTEKEIDGVTAFLRSRASGWDVPKTELISIPTPDEYVLNPNGKRPDFALREDLYVSSKQVFEAMKDSAKMVILDARSKVAWRQTHIPGAVPVPYYEEPENFVNDLPNDDTWIIVYCACPHAASQRVVNTLKRYGFKNTAIIDEGVLVWAQMGYPVKFGQ